MDARNKVILMSALLLIAAVGVTIPVASDDETVAVGLEAESAGDSENASALTDDLISVAISLAAIVFTILGMLYIVQRMKKENMRV